MASKTVPAYNPWFLWPAVVWVVAGAVLIFAYDNITLFRFINGHYSDFLNVVMYYSTWMGQAEVIVPVLAGLMLLPRFRNWWYFWLAIACNVVPMIVSQSLKTFFFKPRPMHYFEGNSWIHILEHWDRYFERSFPSGHSEGAFSFFCFLSLLLPGRYRVWALAFFLLAVLVCYSRVYLTAHFFEDVYAGSIVGMVTTTIVYVVMNKYRSRLFKKSAAL